jgi:hypothetical protein
LGTAGAFEVKEHYFFAGLVSYYQIKNASL